MNTIKSIGVNITVGAVMTIVTTMAQVGLEFYKISQLPTAAQFGSQCLSTFAKGGLVFGACAVIALGIDALFDTVQEKYFYQDVVKENVETKTEVVLCYLLKRAITVICVGSFVLLTGSSILVPIAVIVVLLAKDALERLIRTCQLKRQQYIENTHSTNQSINNAFSSIINSTPKNDWITKEHNLSNAFSKLISGNNDN